MKRHLHSIALALFMFALLFDLIVWGAAPTLPDAGAAIVSSAKSEAFLASGYITLGQPLVDAVPALGQFGAKILNAAIEPSYERISEDPNVAMDLILNASYGRVHYWLKLMYWSVPVLLFLSIGLWLRKPKQVSLMRGR
jgi:hypothetical protein